jgi:hypothetical protein
MEAPETQAGWGRAVAHPLPQQKGVRKGVKLSLVRCKTRFALAVARPRLSPPAVTPAEVTDREQHDERERENSQLLTEFASRRACRDARRYEAQPSDEPGRSNDPSHVPAHAAALRDAGARRPQHLRDRSDWAARATVHCQIGRRWSGGPSAPWTYVRCPLRCRRGRRRRMRSGCGCAASANPRPARAQRAGGSGC